MRKIIQFAILFFIGTNLLGQSGAKKYGLVEHFTNLPCPVCASRNPNLYNRLSTYTNSVHHIAFYPGTPYSSCAYYQANTAENLVRKAFYGVNGSPQVFFQGLWVNDDAGFISTAKLNALATATSPLEIKVEDQSGATKKIKLKNLGLFSIGAGNLKLFVALVEKQINFLAPNGESIHKDVFRKFLTNPSGNDVVLIPSGGEAIIDLPYTISPNWVGANMYALAWVQDISNKEVINSGSENDITSVEDIILDNQALKVFPNPSISTLNIDYSKYKEAKSIELWDAMGKILYQTDITSNSSGVHSLDVSNLASGAYHIRLKTNLGIVTKTIVK